ncbi:olfactory receptor 8S1-like [Dromiciops gliroides]|uniref:olfactory receptor 8S1-like n=1 Tax=Dromiciops gliroides TaxID=33562 RepID=UPI001CC5806A|nr:olfactory receptor 8S1-like [Dromiciops gliroides]
MRDNQTTDTEFILLPFPSSLHIQYMLGFIFLLIYLLTLAGNLLIMSVIKMDSHLHTPMYFFLVNLSFFDIFYSSVMAPKLVYTLLSKKKTISLSECLIQIGLMFFIASSESFILSAMAYDRYSAICNPLIYVMVMSKRFCIFLACGSCLLGVINSLLNILPLLRLHFCGPYFIHHYSCELPELLPLSCTDLFLNKMILFTTLVIFGFGCFFPIMFSYTRIISAILKINSASGRSKAFSTCSSHVIVVTLFFLTGVGRYLSPATGSILEQVISLQYSIVTPLLNPIIYSLKNVEVKTAIKKMWEKKSILSGSY